MSHRNSYSNNSIRSVLTLHLPDNSHKRAWSHRLHKYLLPLLAVLLLGAQPAFAHNKLTASSPADKATLESSPATLELSFSDATWLESVELLDAAGTPVALEFTAPTDQASGFSIPLPALPAGSYTVKWLVEGSDTHRIPGEFTFTISAAP
jgi:methionine-rich copper-binding protein CopC